jgi:hypothetical protein
MKVIVCESSRIECDEEQLQILRRCAPLDDNLGELLAMIVDAKRPAYRLGVLLITVN